MVTKPILRSLAPQCRWYHFLVLSSDNTLPVIETQAGDISAYIPINMFPITDG